MAADMFLKLEGIEGDSEDKLNHAKEIELLSWSWGCSQSGNASTSTGQSAGGRVSVHDISFTKHCDKATPNLILFCCNGEHIPKGKLTVRKSAGATKIEYFTMDLEEMVVSSYQTGGAENGGMIIESVSLNFRKFKAGYTPQLKNNTAGTPIYTGWDLSSNVKS